MAEIINVNSSTTINFADHIQYSEKGIFSQVLLKDADCQYTLLCLRAGTEIAEHTNPRNATINVLEGKGILILEGEEIVLEPGKFIFMKANAAHALKTTENQENLAFLLTLSASSTTV